MKIHTFNPNKTKICQKLMCGGLNGTQLSWGARQSLTDWGPLCHGTDRAREGAEERAALAWACPVPGSGVGTQGLTFRCVLPRASSMSVPALAGKLGAANTHIPSARRRRPARLPAWRPVVAIWGGPAGGAPRSGPHALLHNSVICICEEETRTLSMNSTLAPQCGPLTSMAVSP